MHALIEKSTGMANLGWVYVAIAAGVLGVCLLVLARIRSFQARPLRICFVLSICAHLLLLAVFYLSRVLEMPYIPGSQRALIVQICLDDELEDTQSHSVAPDEIPTTLPAPPSLDDVVLVPTPTPEPPVEESQPDPSSMELTDSGPPAVLERSNPSLEPLARDEPSTSDAISETASPDDTTPRHSNEHRVGPPGTDLPDVVAIRDENASPLGSLPTPGILAKENLFDSTVDIAAHPNPVSPERTAEREDVLGLGGAWRPMAEEIDVPHRYRDRFRRPTGERLKRRGGNPSTERAVEAALLWLAKNQAADGRWDAAQHGAGRGGWIEGQHRGSTGMHADTGITGLALLSFLGAGNTHTSGSYQETVKDALQFLQRQQTATGSLGGDATIYAQMYCHGIATLALCEALAMTRDEKLEVAAQRAIDFTIAGQHRGTGGWRYRPGDPGDTSQFGWQLMSIVSAREAKLRVPDDVVQRMSQFLNSVQSGRYGGLASYRPRHEISRAMTAEALACRNFLGLHEDRCSQEAIRYIVSMKPGVGPRNFYYWYYATIALSQLECDEWGQWNEALQSDLLKTQRRTGPVAGSWEPNTVWGSVGGRVYSTSMATLCLESYYRYAK